MHGDNTAFGTGGGASSLMLPTITAEIRKQFVPLLYALEGMDNFTGHTYLIELVFSLVRFDACLSTEERTLFVRAFDSVIKRLLANARKTAATRAKLEELQAFLVEIISRCEALQDLCEAHPQHRPPSRKETVADALLGPPVAGPGEGNHQGSDPGGPGTTPGLSDKQMTLQQTLQSSFRRRLAVGIAGARWAAPASLSGVDPSGSPDNLIQVADGLCNHPPTSFYPPQQQQPEQDSHQVSGLPNPSASESTSTCVLRTATARSQSSGTPPDAAVPSPIHPTPDAQQQTGRVASTAEEVWATGFWTLVSGTLPVADVRLLIALLTQSAVNDSLSVSPGSSYVGAHVTSPTSLLKLKRSAVRAPLSLEEMMAENGSPVQWELWVAIQAVLSVLTDGLLNSGDDVLHGSGASRGRRTPLVTDTVSVTTAGRAPVNDSFDIDIGDATSNSRCDPRGTLLPSSHSLNLLQTVFYPSLRNYISNFATLIRVAPALAAQATMAREGLEAARHGDAIQQQQQQLCHTMGSATLSTGVEHNRSTVDLMALTDRAGSPGVGGAAGDLTPNSLLTSSFALPTYVGVLTEGGSEQVRPVDVVLHILVHALQGSLAEHELRNMSTLCNRSDAVADPIGSPQWGRQQPPWIRSNDNFSFTSFESSTLMGPVAHSGQTPAVRDEDSMDLAAVGRTLPYHMLTELYPMLDSVRDALTSVQSIERQLEGEVTLVIFRVLTTVLDCLIPLVSVADYRVSLFYRKWTCDLYRLLQEEELLERLQAILQQISLPEGDVSVVPEPVESSPTAGEERVAAAAAPGSFDAPPSSVVDPTTPSAAVPTKTQSKISKKKNDKKPKKEHPPSVPDSITPPRRSSKPSVPAVVEAAATTKSITAPPSGGKPQRQKGTGTRKVPREKTPTATATLTPAVDVLINPPEECEQQNSGDENAAAMTAAAPGTLLPTPEGDGEPQDKAEKEEYDLIPVPAACQDDAWALVVPGSAVQLLIDGQRLSHCPDPSDIGGNEDFNSRDVTHPTLSTMTTSVTRRSRPKELAHSGGPHVGTAEGLAVRTAHALLDSRTTILPPQNYVMNRLIAATVRGLDTECVPVLRSVFCSAARPSSTVSGLFSAHSVGGGLPGGGATLFPHMRGVHGEPQQDGPHSSQRRCVGSAPVPAPSDAREGVPVADTRTTGDNLGGESLALMHHHRYHYPVVATREDVAQLYLATLAEMEVSLSPHDPIRAALVQNTVDFLLSSVHDGRRARDILDAYLAEVNEERVQLPLVHPVVLVGLDISGSPITIGGPTATPKLTTAATSANSSAFSVTSVRRSPATPQAARAAGAASPHSTAAGPPADALNPATSPHPQMPMIPVVIPSWSSDEDRHLFLTVLETMRQTQIMLHERLE